jgi:hypothetical protein
MSCTSTNNVRFQLRRALESQWISSNPVLLPGEPAVSTDTKQIKIGNGSNWVNTDYINLAGGVGPSGTPTTLQTLLTISTALTKSLTVISLSAPITLKERQAVVFSDNITGSGGNNIVEGAVYFIFAAVTSSTSIQVSLTPGGSAY